MASEALKKFADELKFIRESKTITLQQIAGKTKIDLKFLHAIEDANFDVLPEIYIRAFIKEYSQTLDLDPKETLQKFDNAISGKLEEKQPIENHQMEESEKIIPKTEPIKSKQVLKEFISDETIPIQPDMPEVKIMKSIKINYLIGGIISVVALLLIYFAFFNGSSSKIIQVSANQNSVNTNDERFELEKKDSVESQAENPTPNFGMPLSTDSLRLSVLTTDRVWLKVSTDGKILQQGIVEANEQVNCTAKKNFSLSIGNAGRVKVYFNSKPVDNVGKPGEIRNLFITSDGIRYYTIPPKKNEEKSPTSN